MRQHLHHFPPSFQPTWKAVTAYSFYPRRYAASIWSSYMYNLDLSNKQDFLKFCESIDLTPYVGATFQVGSEITGVIEG